MQVLLILAWLIFLCDVWVIIDRRLSCNFVGVVLLTLLKPKSPPAEWLTQGSYFTAAR